MALFGRFVRSQRCGGLPPGKGYSSVAPLSVRREGDKQKFAQENISFEADWGFLSTKGLSQVVKEILADFLGLPPPPLETLHDSGQRRKMRLQSMANIEQIYSQQRLKKAGERGYLVRALLYDASALMQSHREKKAPLQKVQEGSDIDSEGDDWETNVLKRAELAKRDWESYVLGEEGSRGEEGDKSSGSENVKVGMTVSEVMVEVDQDPVTGAARQQKLGRAVKLEGGKLGKDGAARVPRKIPKSKQQELEEAMGKQESVRAKYMAKIMEKKMLADIREDQGKFNLTAVRSSVRPNREIAVSGSAKEKGWVAMPGSFGLLRHFRERGLLQGLLEPLEGEDLVHLQDQLGNFPFDPIAHIGPDQLISRKRLESISSCWGLKPQQVMLVLGTGEASKNILQGANRSGYFVVQIGTALPLAAEGKLEVKTDAANEKNNLLLTSGAMTKDAKTERFEGEDKGRNGYVKIVEEPEARPKEGGKGLQKKEKTESGSILSWYKKLADGTLHLEKQKLQHQDVPFVHYTVSDMTELKWVIEDLNGVSYRQSTFVRGQDKSGHSPAIVMRKTINQTS